MLANFVKSIVTKLLNPKMYNVPKIVKYNNPLYLTIKMTDRYAMANVCLPICIHHDGTISHLTKYISVALEPCDKLPDNLPISNVGADFARQLQHILNNYKPATIDSQPTLRSGPNQEEPKNTLTVTHHELNAHSGKPPVHNTSFKMKRPTYNRHTAKNYPSS